MQRSCMPMSLLDGIQSALAIPPIDGYVFHLAGTIDLRHPLISVFVEAKPGILRVSFAGYELHRY